MDLMAKNMESYAMRNMFLSMSQYSACLTAGCLSEKSKIRENLMNLYSRLSLCRTINRSLDYFGCLSRIRAYGFGRHDPSNSVVNRLLQLANNLFDLIYYPVECTAWLCEASVFGVNRSSKKLRLISTLCWLGNIIVSLLSNTLRIIYYRRQLTKQNLTGGSSIDSQSIKAEITKCYLTMLNSLCFFINCIHWLPIQNCLWSNKLSVFGVGLCGTIASLCNIVKLML